MPTKMRSTSSKAMVLGWRWPTLFFFAGRVTSISSLFICSSLKKRSIFFFASSNTFSNSALTSLTIWPTLGRSSGATSFMPFSTAVSSPFFPRKFTLTSFNFSSLSEECICFKASSFIRCNFSFIPYLFSKILTICFYICKSNRGRFIFPYSP